MAVWGNLLDATRDLVKRKLVFDEEDRKKFQKKYVEDNQSSRNDESTIESNLRSNRGGHEPENSANEVDNSLKNLKEASSLTTDNASSKNDQRSDQVLTAGTSKRVESLEQDESAAMASTSSVRLLTPPNKDFSETVQQKLVPWIKNISESNLDAAKIKISETGFKFAVAKINLHPGDYVVELKGQILAKSRGNELVQNKEVQKHHLYDIRESDKCYYLDTTRCRNWAGCFVKRTSNKPNCGLAEINVLGILKFVFYALENIAEGKTLRFCPKNISEHE